jgi:hypothetical protein
MALDHPEVPKELPAYSRVLAASDGRVWAQIYAPDPLAPGQWDVFDGQGEWLGQVTAPAGFVAQDISADRIVGVWRDRLGVEHVQLYRLRDVLRR